MESQRIRLTHLKEMGFSPSVVLDIGAHEGKWTKMFKTVFTDTRVHMFEANNEHKETLSKLVNQPMFRGNTSFSIQLLSAYEAQNVKYYKARQGCNTGNSVYKENSVHFDEGKFEVVDLRPVTLDSAIAEMGFNEVNLIKIDVQGAELDVLHGAHTTLQKTEFVLLEVQLINYNHQAPVFFDVLRYMDDIGFTAYDIVELHYQRCGALGEADILFVRKNSSFLNLYTSREKASLNLHKRFSITKQQSFFSKVL